MLPRDSWLEERVTHLCKTFFRPVSMRTGRLMCLGATEESRRGVLITVIGDVGLNYLDLRGLQKQLAVANDNLRLQEQTLALTRDRFRAGLANELDTSRAEAQTANTRSQIPL